VHDAPIVSIGFQLGIHLRIEMRMQLFQIAKASVNTAALLLSPFWVGPVFAQSTSTDAQTKTDNTGVNKRDRNPGAVTADQQKMNAADRSLTAKIRRAIMADKSLSTYAHNVKIVSQDGTVTLKGPVRSDDEVKSIVSKAIGITNSAEKVINQMSVEPKSKP
jgi:hyperosmotically inducible periplasmic protein